MMVQGFEPFLFRIRKGRKVLRRGGGINVIIRLKGLFHLISLDAISGICSGEKTMQLKKKNV